MLYEITWNLSNRQFEMIISVFSTYFSAGIDNSVIHSYAYIAEQGNFFRNAKGPSINNVLSEGEGGGR